MGDSFAEVNSPAIIESEGCHSVKETFVQALAVDVLHEENKDKEPEILDKCDSHLTVPVETINELSEGILSFQIESLKKLSLNLTELNRNQDAVIETLQQENARFVETLKMYNLDDIFSRAKLYSLKLQQIKKEMSTVHEKSNKLKKRALRLQQQKQKEALNKELQRDQELERDKQLAPKMATKS